MRPRAVSSPLDYRITLEAVYAIIARDQQVVEFPDFLRCSAARYAECNGGLFIRISLRSFFWEGGCVFTARALVH